uniref:Uncharacterized protein n=1 Tax=Anguilla anguilla TaxID=7936 RepID=A0A0E9Q490_ANGAN
MEINDSSTMLLLDKIQFLVVPPTEYVFGLINR